MREITRILAETPPLGRSQEMAWIDASFEPRASRIALPFPGWVAAGLVAASLILVTCAWLAQRPPGTGPEVVRPISPAPSPVIEQPSKRERLAIEMLAQVDRLESELDDLRRRVDLIDPRDEAEALWDRIGRPPPPPL